MVAQARATTGAVHRHLIVAEEQRPIPELAQNPPERLDVLSIVGVIPISINPIRNPFGKSLPLLNVFPDTLAAKLIESGDAVLLDVGLAAKAEFLLDLNLNREPVSIPTLAATDNLIALHRPIAQDDVFERATDNVVQTGATISGGRAFVEDKRLRACRERLGDNLVVRPPCKDVSLKLGKRDIRVNGLEHGYLVVRHWRCATRFRHACGTIAKGRRNRQAWARGRDARFCVSTP